MFNVLDRCPRPQALPAGADKQQLNKERKLTVIYTYYIIYIYIHTYVCICIYIYIYISVYTYLYIYIYICIHIFVDLFIYNLRTKLCYFCRKANLAVRGYFNRKANISRNQFVATSEKEWPSAARLSAVSATSSHHTWE